MLEQLEPRLLLDGTIYVVDSITDDVLPDGDITLREALEAANTNAIVHDAPAGSDTETDIIQFSPSLSGQTITLGGTELDITDELEIHGLGAGQLTIDADDLSRVFDVDATIAAISGLLISGGNDSNGGAIRNIGELNLSSVSVAGNQSSDAGIIYNTGTITIDDSSVSSNTTIGSSGGTIVNDGVSSVLLVTESLISDNTGPDGAGIRNTDGDATIINSTISGNTATGVGGGFHAYSGTCQIVQATIINNHGSQGGGIYCNTATVTVDNTVVADNTADSTGQDVLGTFDSSSDYNLIGIIDDSSGLDNTNTQYGSAASPLDPMLGPLADNGGPTYTHMPWDGSPLLDAGDNNRALDDEGVPLTTDQRGTGFDRILNGTVDIGAIEGSRAVDFTLSGPLGSYFLGDTIPITWDPTGVPVNSTISLYYDIDTSVNGNEEWIIQDITVPPSGQYDWDPPLYLFGEYYIGGSLTAPDETEYTDRLVSPIEIITGGTGYVVDSDEDIVAVDGLLTLREAIQASVTNTAVGDAPAGSSSYHDLIDFDATLEGETIVLSLGDFDITDDLVIRGFESKDLTINADSSSRIFDIAASVQVGMVGLTLTDGSTTSNGGAILNAGELELTSMVITDCMAEGDGGGIYNTGTLTIADSLITQNATTGSTSSRGAGINNQGSLLLTDVQITSNVASNNGGGIFTAGNLEVTDLTLETNFSFDNGGGIYVTGGDFYIVDSTVNDNTGSDGGGGIWIAGANSAEITNTTFDHNIATGGSGGGLYHSAGVALVLTNVEFTDNEASSSGGGICITAGDVTITDSSFADNTAGSHGGGIYDSSSGTLVLENTTVSDNSAGSEGGGLCNYYGTVRLLESTIVSGNSAGTYGGGVCNSGSSSYGYLYIYDSQVIDNTVSGGTVYGGGVHSGSHSYLNLQRSQVSGNQATGSSNAYGGGVHTNNDRYISLYVTDSTIADNQVSGGTGGYGGGLYIDGNDRHIERCTISGNTVYGASTSQGGGIYLAGESYYGNTFTVTNSTVSGNQAFGSSSAQGGGLYLRGATNITQSTITLNDAAYGGGVERNAGNIRIKNTIVAGNTSEYGGPDVRGTFHTDSAYNLIGIIDGSTNLDGDPNTLYGTGAGPLSAELGALADNGGYTKTHALLDGSPAINAGNNSLALDRNGNPLTTDQRGTGYDRILEGTVDIGSNEGSLTEAFDLSGPTGVISAGNWEIFTWDPRTIPATSTLWIFADPDEMTPDDEITLLAASNPNPLEGSWTWPVVNIPAGTYTLGAKVTNTVTGAELESSLATPTTIVYDLAYTVNSLDDTVGSDGFVTFREALAAANSNQVVGDAHAGRADGIDIILFDPTLNGETILLTEGQLLLSEDISIQGPGDALLTVERYVESPAARLFEVEEEVTSWITGLRLYGGITNDANGGGILNAGTLDLADVTLTSNLTYQHGGAIYNSGVLTVTECIVDGNVAGGASSHGGGIYNTSAGIINITDTVISNNTATLYGGGMLSYGTATLNGVTVYDNTANYGGGLFLQYLASLEGCSVSENEATTYYGGGLYIGSGSVAITDSSFADNTAGSRGGGIYDSSSGTLVLENTTVSGNSAGTHGGGVFHESGSMYIYDSQVIDNTVSGGTVYGGGIYSGSQTYLNLQRSQVLGNQATGSSNAYGGGIYIADYRYSDLYLTDSTIADNQVSGGTGGYGGGLYINNDIKHIERCTISGNTVYGASTSQGGGIYLAGESYYGNTFTVTNSTVSGNQVFGSSSAQGGGLYLRGATNITQSTITLNDAAYGGGVERNAGDIRIKNTIVAGNTSEYGGPDVRGTFHTDSAYNLIGIIDGSTNLDLDPNTLYGTGAGPLSAELGALADNGGYTKTHALLDGSPAINAGNNSLALDRNGNPLWTDQRGETRYLDGVVDIGSYEGSVTEAFLLSGPTGTIYAGEPQTISWTNESITATSLLTLYADPDGLPENGNEIELLSEANPNLLGGAWTWYALEVDLEEGVPYTLGGYVVDQITENTIHDRLGSITTISYSGIYLVDSLADTTVLDGELTLREALEAANTNTAVGDAFAGRDDAVDIIRFDPSLSGQTITISATGQFEIADDLAIQGLGDDSLSILGNGSERIFEIDNNVLAWISGLTLTGGSTDEHGGGIFNSGTLDLADVTLSSNLTSQHGGAIYNSGVLTVTECIVDGNVAGGASSHGGGIYNTSAGIINITDTVISNNTATSYGGGMLSYGTATLNGVTVYDNTANYGGGLFLQYLASLEGCSVSENEATNSGGGLYISSGSVAITDSSFADNTAGSHGGGIYDSSTGTLVLENTTVSGNSAGSQGGGLCNYYGTVRLLESTIVSGNSAGTYGGGVWNSGSSSYYTYMYIYDSQVIDNTVSGSTVYGGGIYSGSYSYLNLQRSQVSGNQATGSSNAYGGGIYITDESYTDLYLTDSTIADNQVSGGTGGYGGGLYIYNDIRHIERCTISGNTVYGASTSQGGGIYLNNNDHTLTVTNSTVSGNQVFGSSTAQGGGLYLRGATNITQSTITLNDAAYGGGVERNAGDIRIKNTIVAGNTAEYGGPDVRGTFHTDSAYNLIGIIDGSTNLDLDPNTLYGTGAAPLSADLGALADNGGYTQTHALLDGSPAINAGNNSLALDRNGNPLTTDQRGGTHLRILDGTVDMGSYEGREDTYFALLAPAGGTVYAAWDTLIQWTGVVPTTSEISIYYDDVNDPMYENDGWIIQDRSYVQLGGSYAWTSAALPDGRYAIGATVTDPENPGWSLDDRTAEFDLVHAAVPTLYVVDTYVDIVAVDGMISLREALEAANTNTAVGDAPAGDPVEMDVIQFDDSLIGQVITLSGPLSITNHVEIEGIGEGDYRVTIDADGTGPVFEIDEDVYVVMNDMRLTGGVNSEAGGAIANAGMLSLDNMEIYDNSAPHGGGIGNSEGDVSATRVWIHDNTATAGSAAGGGIFTEWGLLELLDSTISGNSAYYGGGIYGGWYGEIVVSNSTISSNSVSGTNAAGGGLYNTQYSDADLINTTVTVNSASGTTASGGGVVVNSGTVKLVNTIGAENTAPTNPDVQGDFDPAGDYNLIGVIDGSTGLDSANTLYGNSGAPLDPLLDVLADNGGPTPTHDILVGSLTINGGDDTSANDPWGDPLDYDQRGIGYDRILLGSVDIGAIEYQDIPENPPPEITGLDLSDDPLTVGSSITLTALGVSDDHGVAAVTFYHDANRDGDGMPDEILGVDTVEGDGWSWTGIVTWDPGQADYLAQVTDDGWPSGTETSDFVGVTGTVISTIPPDIDVGNHYLLAGVTGQEVEIYVSGLDKVTGFNLNAQLGDGAGGNAEPIFQSVDFAGGIWDAYPYTVTGGVIGGTPQLIEASIDFSNINDEVLADGLLVTLVIDTQGFSAGQNFDLKLSIDAGPLDSEFILYNGHELYPTITHGQISLYESNVVDRHIFYNNSYFDGYNTAANAADDSAIATNKEALLPGETANFSNYTGYWRGINGVMVDIEGLSNPSGLSLSDFTFKVGNSNDTCTWSSAPDPTLPIPVREGGGVAGSDRITLIWPDNAIKKEWLQVTVLSTPNTGLAEDDVFYFGNAVGEVGNSASNAYVDGVDFALTRDNFRNFLNPAPVTNNYDHNRDRLVDGTDLAIVRDNPTNILTALKLITPTGGCGGGMLAMQGSDQETNLGISEPSLIDDILRSSSTEITNQENSLITRFNNVITPNNSDQITPTGDIIVDNLESDQDEALLWGTI